MPYKVINTNAALKNNRIYQIGIILKKANKAIERTT
jgi:hypothetical protein